MNFKNLFKKSIKSVKKREEITDKTPINEILRIELQNAKESNIQEIKTEIEKNIDLINKSEQYDKKEENIEMIICNLMKNKILFL